MKDVGDGLGIKNISVLGLKEIYGICEKKELTKEEIKCYKSTEREIFKKFTKLSEDKLNTKCKKKYNFIVMVKNTYCSELIFILLNIV